MVKILYSAKNEDIEYRYGIDDNEKENIDAHDVLPQTI